MHDFVGFLQIAGQQKGTCETQSRVAGPLFLLCWDKEKWSGILAVKFLSQLSQFYRWQLLVLQSYRERWLITLTLAVQSIACSHFRWYTLLYMKFKGACDDTNIGQVSRKPDRCLVPCMFAIVCATV